MKNTFTLFDICNLMKSFGCSSIGHDCLAHFLNTYDFESVYETDDNSLVFDAGGENKIEIEFFNFSNPLKREISIMYFENGAYKILYHEDLMKLALAV
ncbi:MAG: hypothetical protein PUE72_01265 [Lachnospiraceae bacterium]|nr:hypothetical protein [Lachnospiraceae bacterium]